MSQPAFDFGDDPADPTFTVGELAGAVNAVLQRGFRDGVWVRGEIQGFQERGNGHLWFQLTEQTDEGKATVSVVLFAGAATRMLPLLRRHRIRLENGIAVRIHGRLDFYGPTGRITLVMDQLDARFTLGQLAGQRDQLLRALVAEGLLDRNRRLPLPLVPLRVGVVTSRDSAAWHDFRAELHRSGLAFRLRLADVRVQGEGADAGVAAAIAELASQGVDVVAVIRGGGARTDLATFDAEAVARAIATAPVPVLTGLGHEVDRSVADEVAHTALKTPTACAAALVERVRAYQAESERLWRAIARRGALLTDRAEAGLSATARRISHRTAQAVGMSGQRLDHHAAHLRRAATASLDRADARLARGAVSAASASRRALTAAERAVAAGEARTRALDPVRTLARGWSITRRADGSLVRDAARVQAGDELITTLADGEVRSRAVARSEP
jgi:exodeoxyribonuclease VII large subunit